MTIYSDILQWTFCRFCANSGNMQWTFCLSVPYHSDMQTLHTIGICCLTGCIASGMVLKWHWHWISAGCTKSVIKIALTNIGMYYKFYGTHQFIHSGCPEEPCLSTVSWWPLSVWRSRQEKCLFQVSITRIVLSQHCIRLQTTTAEKLRWVALCYDTKTGSSRPTSIYGHGRLEYRKSSFLWSSWVLRRCHLTSSQLGDPSFDCKHSGRLQRLFSAESWLWQLSVRTPIGIALRNPDVLSKRRLRSFHWSFRHQIFTTSSKEGFLRSPQQFGPVLGDFETNSTIVRCDLEAVMTKGVSMASAGKVQKRQFCEFWSIDTSCTAQSSGQLRFLKIFDHKFDDFEANFFEDWRAPVQHFQSHGSQTVKWRWLGPVHQSAACLEHCHLPRHSK